jgi:isopentenyldiphosphate isomerase/intracellular septation protein A
MNRTLILRQLLPGLAPLIIFVVADEIWGTHIGLMVAMGFGLVELGISLVRKKRPDKFLLLDLGLIMAMGGISLWLDNDLFFKLKPVVIGGLMCAMMAAMAYLPGNMLQAIQERYMAGMAINPWQQYEFKKSIGRLVWVLVAHTLITLATVFMASNRVWGAVSGPGFFVAAAVWMGWEFIVKKQQKKRFANQEWLPLVDEKGNIIGSAPRSVVHGGSMLLHPVVHLHVVTNNGIYLQKRPMFKQIQPGKWDTAVGGHISAGEPIDKALQRETREEIGLDGFEAKLFANYVWTSKVERELIFAFITHTTKPPVPNLDEVDEGRFWSIGDIEAAMGKGILTPNFEHEYNHHLKARLAAELP